MLYTAHQKTSSTPHQIVLHLDLAVLPLIWRGLNRWGDISDFKDEHLTWDFNSDLNFLKAQILLKDMGIRENRNQSKAA